MTTTARAVLLGDRYDEGLPDVADHWICPGCTANIEPSDVRRHANECAHVNGAGQPITTT